MGCQSNECRNNDLLIVNLIIPWISDKMYTAKWAMNIVKIASPKLSFNPLMYNAFAIELSDLSKPFKFARLKGFERLENCLTKGTYERFWKVKQLSEQTYHSPIFLPFKSFQRVLKGVVVHIDSHFASKQIWKVLKGQTIGGLRSSATYTREVGWKWYSARKTCLKVLTVRLYAVHLKSIACVFRPFSSNHWFVAIFSLRKEKDTFHNMIVRGLF